MNTLSRLLLLPFLCLGACSNESGGDGDGDTSLAEVEEYWHPAEGDWVTTERAITPNCETEISELTFFPEDEADQRCISLEFDDYQGTPLLVGRNCGNGLPQYPASFEANDEGRMLDTPLEYFADGTTEYPCDWSRSQSELVLVDGTPFIVLWIWDAELEGVIECPDELPENAAISCIKSVYRLEPASGE